MVKSKSSGSPRVAVGKEFAMTYSAIPRISFCDESGYRGPLSADSRWPICTKPIKAISELLVNGTGLAAPRLLVNVSSAMCFVSDG